MSNFPDIDTSYWKLHDKEWVKSRKLEWDNIELMFSDGVKSKKGLAIIKAYFLRGKMPDFLTLKKWNNIDRHLDLFCFLWLHPESDFYILKNLRDEYVSSKLVTDEDIKIGFNMISHWCCVMASQEYTKKEIAKIISTNGFNELLFRVIYGDIGVSRLPESIDLEFKFNKSKDDLGRSLITMTHWLCNKKLNVLNEDCLYQSNYYLDYWYSCMPENNEYFSKPINKITLNPTRKGLYRIYTFDTEKEGDTPRTRFVTKMRKILDEREFIPEFKQMWEDVKSGKIVVENAWER